MPNKNRRGREVSAPPPSPGCESQTGSGSTAPKSELKEVDLGSIRPPAEVADHDDELLDESIGQVGQLNPLILDTDMFVHGGRRRYWAAKRRSDSVVWCRVYADPLEAELAGIDEDVIRAHRSLLDRAERLARRRVLLNSMGRLHGPGRSSNCDTVTQMTTDELAGHAGISRRTLQRAARIAERIPAEVRAALRGTPVEDSTTQLLAVAALDHATQAGVAALLGAGEADTVRAALALIESRRLAADHGEQAAEPTAEPAADEPDQIEEPAEKAAEAQTPPPAPPPAAERTANEPAAPGQQTPAPNPPTGSPAAAKAKGQPAPAGTPDKVKSVDADMQVEQSGTITIAAPTLAVGHLLPSSYRVKIVARWHAELRLELEQKDTKVCVLILPDLKVSRDAG